MDSLRAIEAWRATLPETQRQRLNHPGTVAAKLPEGDRSGAGFGMQPANGAGVPVGANLSLASALVLLRLR